MGPHGGTGDVAVWIMDCSPQRRRERKGTKPSALSHKTPNYIKTNKNPIQLNEWGFIMGNNPLAKQL